MLIRLLTIYLSMEKIYKYYLRLFRLLASVFFVLWCHLGMLIWISITYKLNYTWYNILCKVLKLTYFSNHSTKGRYHSVDIRGQLLFNVDTYTSKEVLYPKSYFTSYYSKLLSKHMPLIYLPSSSSKYSRSCLLESDCHFRAASLIQMIIGSYV